MASGEPTKTIAQPAGEKALTVHCLGPGCHHQAVRTFEELKVWSDMIFVDVAEVSPTCLLEMRKPKREGDADLSSGTRNGGLWQVAVEFTFVDPAGVRQKRA